MKKSIVTFLFLLILFGVVVVPNAYALDMEFYTYGGFDAISTAFKKLALIFSDNDYKALFFSVIAMGILFGAAAAYFNLLRGGKGGVLAWVWPIGIGTVIYLGLIIPKGNITVYDPVMNKFETIGNIPNAVVALAGTLNTIERGIVDIVDTSGTPSSYKDYGFSLGFDTLLKAVGGKPSFGDTFLDATMHKYEEDCLFFALQNAAHSGLTTRQLASESTDFFTEYARGQNPAIFTVVYDETDPGGRTESCTAAWTHLQAELSSSSKLTKLKRFACSRAGFNVDDTAQFQKCSDTLEAFFGVATGVNGLPSATYLRQVYMAQSLENTIKSVDPDFSIRVLSDRGLMEKGIGTGMIMNDWIPVMKAVITAIAIGLIPILVIFLPTPLAGKALGAGAGLFIWITMWGVTDAVVQNVVYEYGMRAFEIVKQNNLGLAAIMYTPNAALKALSMAGMCRGSSVLLATVLTSTIIKFGGYAFTQMMGGMMGAISSQGAMGAGKTMEPQQAAKELSGLRAAPVTMANPYKFDPSTQQKAEAAITTSQMSGKIEGAGMPGAKDAMTLSTMSGLTGGTARGAEIKDQGGLGTVVGAERTGVQAKIGDAAGERLAAEKEGMSVQSAHELTKGIGRSSDIARAKEIGTPEMGQKIGATGAAKNIADAQVRDLVGAENYGTALRLKGTKGVSEDLIAKEMLLDTGIVGNEKEFGLARAGTGRYVLGGTQQGKFNEHFGTDFKAGTVMEYGRDSESNLVLAQGKTGKEFVDMDRDQILHRDTHQTGADYKAGTKIDGADGIMDISPTAARARAEQGDPEVALRLGTGSEEQINRNTLQQAKSMAEYLGKFASDKHTDLGAVIGKVFAEGSVKSGWGTPGLVKAFFGADAGVGGRVGAGVEGKELSQREKQINFLASGLYEAMNKAGKESGHEGIVRGQNMLKAADDFSSAIENEVLSTQPSSKTPTPVSGKAKDLVSNHIGGKLKPSDLTDALSTFGELGPSTDNQTRSVDPIGNEANRQQDLTEGINPDWSEGRKSFVNAMNNPQAFAEKILGKTDLSTQSRDEQSTADMARGVIDERPPVKEETPVGTVDFSRPNKKSQSNISEQEIAKAINVENSPGQDGPAGDKIKKGETPKAPGGGMGAQ